MAVELRRRATLRQPSPMRIGEDLLHRQAEQGGDAEGEVEGGVVLLGLQRIDRLARDAQPRAEVGLRPAPFGAQLAQSVAQGP